MARQKIIVALSSEDQDRLNSIISKGTSPARTIRRAHILLNSNIEGDKQTTVDELADKPAGDAFRHHIDEEDMPLCSQFYAFFKLSGIIYDEKTEPWLVQEDGSFNGAQLMHTLYKGYERLFNSLVPEEAE